MEVEEEIVELQARMAAVEALLVSVAGHAMAGSPALASTVTGLAGFSVHAEDMTPVTGPTHRRFLRLYRDLVARAERAIPEHREDDPHD